MTLIALLLETHLLTFCFFAIVSYRYWRRRLWSLMCTSL